MDDMVTRIGIIVKDETFHFNLLRVFFKHCMLQDAFNIKIIYMFFFSVIAF